MGSLDLGLWGAWWVWHWEANRVSWVTGLGAKWGLKVFGSSWIFQPLYERSDMTADRIQMVEIAFSWFQI